MSIFTNNRLYFSILCSTKFLKNKEKGVDDDEKNE